MPLVGLRSVRTGVPFVHGPAPISPWPCRRWKRSRIMSMALSNRPTRHPCLGARPALFIRNVSIGSLVWRCLGERLIELLVRWTSGGKSEGRCYSIISSAFFVSCRNLSPRIASTPLSIRANVATNTAAATAAENSSARYKWPTKRLTSLNAPKNQPGTHQKAPIWHKRFLLRLA